MKELWEGKDYNKVPNSCQKKDKEWRPKNGHDCKDIMTGSDYLTKKGFEEEGCGRCNFSDSRDRGNGPTCPTETLWGHTELLI